MKEVPTEIKEVLLNMVFMSLQQVTRGWLYLRVQVQVLKYDILAVVLNFYDETNYNM